MTIGNTNVGEIGAVSDSSGSAQPPASDAYVHRAEATGTDINASAASESFTAPDRSDTLTIHAETSGAAHVAVDFEDGDGNVATTRDKGDNTDYEVTSAGDIFITVGVASPHITVRIVDDSGAANSTTYSVYCR